MDDGKTERTPAGSIAQQAAAQASAWKEHSAAAARAYDQGRLRDASQEYEAALRIAESFGFGDPRFGSALNGLACVYRAQGRYAEAEPLFTSALALRQNAFGPESAEAAQTLADLATLYAAERKFGEAETTYRRSLEIQERARGAEHLSLCPTLNNLALLYKEQNRIEEALTLFQRALRIGMKGLGPAHPFVATGLNNLGAISLRLGKSGEAEALFRQSLAIKEKALGPEHAEVATVVSNLAEIYSVQGRAGEARPLYERALRIDEAALGPDHLEVAADLVQLAQACAASGDVPEAQRHYRRAIEIRERSLGVNHPMTAKTRERLAALGGDSPLPFQTPAALPGPEQTPEFQRGPSSVPEVHPPEISDTIGEVEIHAAAAPEADGSRREEVEAYHVASEVDRGEESVATTPGAGLRAEFPTQMPGESRVAEAGAIQDGAAPRDQVPGPAAEIPPLRSEDRKAAAGNHRPRPLVMTAAEPGLDRLGEARRLCELGDRAASDGRWSEAEDFYRRELEVEEFLQGPAEPAVAATLNNLALARMSRGSLSDAAALLQTSLALLLESESMLDSQVAAVMNNLATLCAENEKTGAAKALLAKSAEIQARLRGGSSPANDERLAVIESNLMALLQRAEPET